MIEPKKVVTRFAPSPTGYLHIGGVRTALYAYLYARKHAGTFILRIEDTDKGREVSDSIEHIKESLSWVGIDWDYGPDKPGPFGSCIQSERLHSYKKYAEMLVEKGLAYPDPYTAEEVEVFRKKATEEKRPFLYRDHRPETFLPWDGTKPLRLKVPEVKRYTWNDAARGTLSAGEEMLDDIILIKSDGYPTYNFAHIIDDYEMGVTHVMRADEFIASTPKFLSIYDALGFAYPVFVSLPPILRDDRTKKLGKRDGAKDILDYRNEGFLPEAMANFLALIGWNPGTEQEVFSLEELIEAFDLSKIHRAGAAFNEEKLLWMNKQHLNKLSPDRLMTYIAAVLPEALKQSPNYNDEILKRLVPTVFERTHVASDITEAALTGEYDFAFTTPESYEPELLKWKNDLELSQAKPRLEKAKELLTEADFSSSESIKAALWPYAEEVGKGELLWPLRISLSGRAQSPDPFTIAYIIGKEETLARIKVACDKIGE
ncbi:MAG TPA: glutamate--tRNA ligase [Candidatus Paceibacterota bacterium]|nr:glutamate--tRNA ligase [Candidatus Paceibacterota bacterium]HMO83160.1 glutamate--tRNA ligase [Candidatus Paceibacterota bacterium]